MLKHYEICITHQLINIIITVSAHINDGWSRSIVFQACSTNTFAKVHLPKVTDIGHTITKCMATKASLWTKAILGK